MSEDLVVQSHRGPYVVHFDAGPLTDPAPLLEGEPHFLIDATVARLYGKVLRAVVDHPNAIVIEATEANKSLEGTIPLFKQLVANKVRRGHTLVAIGGGIVQDLTCFIASTLLRGLDWRFVPTTLLAQADSCIGSKSSINLGATKNILGTFNPPRSVFIHAGFLDTLGQKDIHSGVGEIIKVHAIDGIEAFDRVAADYEALFKDRSLLLGYVRQALLVKRRYIEEDEFDRGIRNIFNYGHSFGHAIESATDYAVPHGIAVSMGMDMANFVAARREVLPVGHYQRMHTVLKKNYAGCAGVPVPADALVSALMHDKKNTSTMLGLVFAHGERAEIKRAQVPPDASFRAQCAEFLAEMRA